MSVHPVFKALITLMLITLGFSQVNHQTLFYLNETTYSAALFLSLQSLNTNHYGETEKAMAHHSVLLPGKILADRGAW